MGATVAGGSCTPCNECQSGGANLDNGGDDDDQQWHMCYVVAQTQVIQSDELDDLPRVRRPGPLKRFDRRAKSSAIRASASAQSNDSAEELTNLEKPRRTTRLGPLRTMERMESPPAVPALGSTESPRCMSRDDEAAQIAVSEPVVSTSPRQEQLEGAPPPPPKVETPPPHSGDAVVGGITPPRQGNGGSKGRDGNGEASPYRGGILCLFTPTPPTSPTQPLRPAAEEVDVEATLASVPDDDPELRAAILASLGLKQGHEKDHQSQPQTKASTTITSRLRALPTPFRRRPRAAK